MSLPSVKVSRCDGTVAYFRFRQQGANTVVLSAPVFGEIQNLHSVISILECEGPP